MFTGLVETKGTIDALETNPNADDSRLWVNLGALDTGDITDGESIAINGVCLTVSDRRTETPGVFGFDVMGETLSRSNLGSLSAGDEVNLERAMQGHSRFGGHIVQGHVDGMGELLQRTTHPKWEVLRFSLPTDLARYVVEKGSIAVSGTSLTVSGVSAPSDAEPWFEVSLIPVTLRDTTLGELTTGSTVNLEVDIIGKYLERLRAFDDPAHDDSSQDAPAQ